MLEIRPFTGTEQECIDRVALANAIWPDYPETVEELKHWISHPGKDEFVRRFNLMFEGTPIGYASYKRAPVQGRKDVYYIDINILTDYRQRGFATQFYLFALDELAQLDPPPARLYAETREDQIGALAWIEKLGYVNMMRYPISHLMIQEFDPTAFSGLNAKMAAEEIEIKSLDELRQADPEADYKMWDLTENHIEPDVPTPDHYEPRPFEEVSARIYQHPKFRPDLNFVALHHGEYVAMSNLWGKVGEERLFVGLTGTKRDYRRKGIALALKVATIMRAKESGHQIIETDNEENNPMFDINVKLGFVKKPGWADFKKELIESASAGSDV